MGCVDHRQLGLPGSGLRVRVHGRRRSCGRADPSSPPRAGSTSCTLRRSSRRSLPPRACPPRHESAAHRPHQRGSRERLSRRRTRDRLRACRRSRDRHNAVPLRTGRAHPVTGTIALRADRRQRSREHGREPCRLHRARHRGTAARCDEHGNGLRDHGRSRSGVDVVRAPDSCAEVGGETRAGGIDDRLRGARRLSHGRTRAGAARSRRALHRSNLRRRGDTGVPRGLRNRAARPRRRLGSGTSTRPWEWAH